MLGKNADATRGIGSSRIAGASGPAWRGQANALDPLLTNNAGMLRVYIGAEDRFEQLPRFDGHDIIGTDPTLLDRWRSFWRGDGW